MFSPPVANAFMSGKSMRQTDMTCWPVVGVALPAAPTYAQSSTACNYALYRFVVDKWLNCRLRRRGAGFESRFDLIKHHLPLKLVALQALT